VHLKYIPIYMQQDATLHRFIYVWKLLYMFRVVPPPITRSAYDCMYSIWHLSHRYCYLPLSWKSWNWFECAVGGVGHIMEYISHYTDDTPKRALNPLNAKLNPICYFLALLWAHHFLHVSRIRVKSLNFRLLMSFIYIYIYIVQRSPTDCAASLCVI